MSVHFDPVTGRLTGADVTESTRTLGQLTGWFFDESARREMNPDTVAYRVESYMPLPEGTPGAVCLATTYLMPGMVGDEYFFTRGHFHANPDGPELCVCISGRGALLLMTPDRRTWSEDLRPGIVRPIPEATAHRAANTGAELLVFVSYWASEIGHDYKTIETRGFGARLRLQNGHPAVIGGNGDV
jgi:glucose-6-phosphate isomerase